MKTMKFTLIAALLAFLMVNVAGADDFKSKPRFSVVKNITLEQAKKNPGIVNALYSQVDLGKLIPSKDYMYVGEMKYHGQVYRVWGSYVEWLAFFRLIIIPPVHYRDEMKAIE